MSMVSMIVMALVAFGALIGLLIGIGRKTYRSLLRLATFIIAAIVAVFITAPIVSALYDTVWTMSTELEPSLGQLTEFMANSTVIADVVKTLCVTIISLLLFGAVFIVVSLLMLIPYAITARLLFKDTPKPAFKGDTPVGMLVGAVSGALVIVILLSPLAGLVKTVGDVTASIKQDNTAVEIADTDVNEFITKYIEPVTDNELVSIVSELGNVIYQKLMTADLNGTSINYSAELVNLSRLYPDIAPLMDGSDVDYAALAANAIPKIAESKLVTSVAADMMSGLGKAWAKGEAFMNIEPVEITDFAKPIYDSLVNILASTTNVTVAEDLNTVSTMLATIDKYDVLSLIDSESEADLLDVFAQEGLIEELLTTASSNERTQELVTSVVNAGIEAIGDYLELPSTQAEVRTSFINDVANGLNSLSAEEFKAQFATYMSDNGVELPSVVVELIPSSLYNGFGEAIPNVTADMVEDFFGIAFDISPNELTSVTTPMSVSYSSHHAILDVSYIEFANMLKKMLVEELNNSPELEAAVVTQIRGLANSEEFTSTKLTVEDIKIDPEVIKQKLADSANITELSTSVSSLLNVVNELAPILNNSEAEIKISDLNLKSVGAALDSFLSGDILGDSATSIIDAVLKSDVVKDALPVDVSDINISEIISSTDTSLENVLEAAQKTAEIVDEINNSSSETAQGTPKTEEEKQKSQEKIENNVEWLISNMSPASAKQLKSLISEKVLCEFGIPDEYAGGIVHTLGILFDKMADSSALSADEYKAEANAIQKLFKVAMTSSDEEFDVPGIIDTAMKSKLIIQTIRDVCNENGIDPVGFGKETDVEDVRTELCAYTRANYNNANDKQSFKNSIIALGKLCGTDFTAEFDGWIK